MSEGIFMEPTSAASIVRLKKLVESGKIEEAVVCVTTGYSPKDPDIAVKTFKKSYEVDAELSPIERLLGLAVQLT